MSAPEKQSHGIPISLEFTRKEYDLLLLAARKDKREPKAEVRWLIEAYGTGFLRYSEEGAAARTLLRATESETHYPDSVSVSAPQVGDKE